MDTGEELSPLLGGQEGKTGAPEQRKNRTVLNVRKGPSGNWTSGEGNQW